MRAMAGIYICRLVVQIPVLSRVHAFLHSYIHGVHYRLLYLLKGFNSRPHRLETLFI